MYELGGAKQAGSTYAHGGPAGKRGKSLREGRKIRQLFTRPPPGDSLWVFVSLRASVGSRGGPLEMPTEDWIAFEAPNSQ